jgi:mRNA interferase MazF
MNSKYEQWNNVKKSLARSNHKPPYFKEGEIWWLSIGYNLGHEIYGKGPRFVRPVLIIKKFNRYTFIGVPLSTKIKDNKYYIDILFNNKHLSALISQIRVFSSKRINNKQGKLCKEDYQKVLSNVRELFKLPPSKRGSRG